jgi:tetratricopeptide (TPR) repeat protein
MTEGLLAESEDSQSLLDAALKLMQVKKDSAQVLAGLDKALTKDPGDPHANLYKAIWLWEAGKMDELPGPLERAVNLPGARYLLGLKAVAKREFAAAEKHLTALLALPAEATFRKDEPGLALLQSGSYISATRPRLLLAIVLDAQGKKEEANALLRKLAEDDPALLEAWMLLGDSERLRTLTARNPSGKTAAERVLDALRAGRWDGIGRP